MKFGLLGHHIAYSLSPAIHRMAARSPISYEIFDIRPQDFETELSTRLSELDGFNITIPYKTGILKYCHQIDENARHLGAANTVRIRNKEWKAYNTDFSAFMRVVANHIQDYLYYHPVVVGYGGAARAVLFGLENLGYMNISVLGGHSKAERIRFIGEMRSGLKLRILDNIPNIPLLWINCTPSGTVQYPDIPKLFEAMEDEDFLFDLNYTPRFTFLQQFAEKKGLAHINGLRMLIFQALEAQKIWGCETAVSEKDIEKIVYTLNQ